MLLANNLSFERNGKNLFKELNISLSSKKIIHIKGRNGIGKTTIIKIIANLKSPTTGEMYWNGKNIKKNLNEYFSNITYIMDTQSSKNELTVSENINFWIKLFSSKIGVKEIDSIFDLLSLNNYKNTLVNFLSRGEIKKLELFRLVIEKKKFWLLDEPYMGLDNSTTEMLNETFKNHIKNGGMIIFSSHHNPELQNIETIQVENYADN